MASRVPDSVMYAKGQHSLNTARTNMLKNQEQALTGKRINTPSDDPPSTIQVLQVKAAAERDNAVSQNLEVANSFLSLTDSALGELTEVLSRAKELAIQMSSTTSSTEDSRAAVSNEVEQLGMRTVQIGNTRMGDRYIFAGFQMDRPPFDTAGNYYGDVGDFSVEMDRGQKLTVNVPGTLPFFGLNEITSAAQDIRHNHKRDAEPSISGGLKEVALVSAANKGIDPKNEPEEFAALKLKSGINIFHAFKAFHEGLKTDNKTLVNQAIEDFESGFKQVIAARSMVGARQNVLELSLDSLEISKVTNEELRSRAEDADTMQVYSDLAKNENVLNATLEVNKKLLSPSLLNFLK